MKENLNILKNENISGGTYGEVRIFEETIVSGSLQCDELMIYGKAKFEGTVQAKNIQIKGTAQFHGDLQALNMTVEGTAETFSPIQVNELTVNNQFTAHEKVEAYVSHLKGITEFTDYDGFQLDVYGKLTSSGLFRCNHMKWHPNARGLLNEVMGANVTIKCESPSEEETIRVQMNQLMAYNVDLQHTEIRVLEAKNVELDEHSLIHNYREIGK